MRDGMMGGRNVLQQTKLGLEIALYPICLGCVKQGKQFVKIWKHLFGVVGGDGVRQPENGRSEFGCNKPTKFVA